MPLTQAAQAALLKWINTFPIEHPVRSLRELKDGVILSQVLKTLDPEYDASKIEEPDELSDHVWITYKHNLQSVYKGLCRFQHRASPDCVPLQKRTNFQTVAENPDPAGISQLVVLFLVTVVFAVDDEYRNRYIAKLQADLGPAELQALQPVIKEKQELSARLIKEEEEEDGGLKKEGIVLKLEADLREKTEKLEETITRLELEMKSHADLKSRHTYLTESFAEVKADLEDAQKQLAEARQLSGADESQALALLSKRLEEQEELIAAQEGEIAAHKEREQQQQAEIEKLRTAAEVESNWRDQYDELYHEHKKLESKANAAERYKEKLREHQNLEKENETLRSRIRDQLVLEEKLSKAERENETLKKTETELLVALTSTERAVSDANAEKENLRTLYSDTNTDLIALQHKLAVNEKYLEDLKEEMAPGAGLVPPTPGSGDGGMGGGGLGSSLEQELQQTTNDYSKVKLLEAEIEVLRHGAAAGVGADELRREAERLRAERDLALRKYETVFEKHGVAQEQIEALLQNMTGEGLVEGIEAALSHGSLSSFTSDFYRHAAFANLREAHRKTTAELDELRTKHRRLEEAVRDKDRDLLAMKTDCALLLTADEFHGDSSSDPTPRGLSPAAYAIADADYDDAVDSVGEDRLAALERLKQSDQLIAASLRAELESLRVRCAGLEMENGMHKAQLLEALMAKEKLAKEGGGAPATAEGAAAAGEDAETLKNYRSKAEKLRERVKSQKEVRTRRRSRVALFSSSSAPVTMINALGSPSSTAAAASPKSWDGGTPAAISGRGSSSNNRMTPVLLDAITEEEQPSGSSCSLSNTVVVIPSSATTRWKAMRSPGLTGAIPELRRATPPPEVLRFRERQQAAAAKDDKKRRRSWLGMFRKLSK